MATVIRFAAWVVTQAWRYGPRVGQAAKWAKDNWRTIVWLLSLGWDYPAILRWILDRI